MIRSNDPPTSLKKSAAAQKNVLGGPLGSCCTSPMTGFFRDGTCRTCAEDVGLHVLCCVMTEAFLQYTASCGNDLSTPNPQFGFPGLKPGDRWCVCAVRWLEAMQAGVAPPVMLSASNEAALAVVRLEDLQAYAVDEDQPE